MDNDIEKNFSLGEPDIIGVEPQRLKRSLRDAIFWLPWLVLLALFSLLPELPRVPGVSQGTASVAGHFLVYGVLAAIIYRLHTRIWSGPHRNPIDSTFTAVGGSAFIGLMFEWSQQVFTSSRAFQAEDVVANTAGAVTVSGILLLLDSRGVSLNLLLPAVSATGAAIAILGAASYLTWDPALAYEGDHWHAPYRVVICGETQQFFPYSTGALHTRGDGIIHVRPRGSGIVGEKANLAAFFDASGGVLTNSSMTLPTGRTVTNGDRCPDGSVGVVSVSQFDLETMSLFDIVTEPADYLPRDSQLLIIAFGPLEEPVR